MLTPDSPHSAPTQPAQPAPRGPTRRSDDVAVRHSPEGARLIALRRFGAGESIVALEGELTDRPSRHTLQIDVNLHLDTPPSSEVQQQRYCWRYLNHSCDPNAFVRGRQVVAARAIAAGEDVTFDYNTTEWSLAAPFTCRCGSARCVGEIRGFKHLTAAQRAGRAHLAPHLARLAARPEIAPPSGRGKPLPTPAESA